MKRLVFSFFLFSILVIMSGCGEAAKVSSTEKKAALLLESTFDDQGWNKKGYDSLLHLKSDLNMEVTYEENINTPAAAAEIIQKLDERNFGLIIGHGQIFAEYFSAIRDSYPQIQFVAMNGEGAGDNVTTLQFDGYAMGYFAGRLAGQMSETQTIGVIGAKKWQPEVEGYIEGAATTSTDLNIKNEIVNGWDDKEGAFEALDSMLEADADIVYPAGDGFHVEVIKKLKEKDRYAIGYVGEQSDLGESTVLTSTIQHVDKLYRIAADEFLAGTLDSGTHTYDFAEDAISLGNFSPAVPDELQEQLTEEIEEYKTTGKLPGQ
ncbi:BMP family ABC transporter substrate-binding protein [Alteribacillus sp. HJP-4]|uniref:BMP family ABC transporter substrate-binding protein n=1 Tax=Alteribacillus sp. HJP-4 TaxID=2775394 RepID=UPI0035CCCCFF